MRDTHNVDGVVQRVLKHYRVRVYDETISESLQSHPEYPSLKSICDAFNSWQIDCYPMRLTQKELEELDLPFIAHLNHGRGKVVFVEKLDSTSSVQYYDTFNKKRTENKGDFFNKYSGAALVVEPRKNSGEEIPPDKKKNNTLRKIIPILGIGAALLAVSSMILSFDDILLFQNEKIFFAVTKVIGLALCIMLILKEQNVGSSLIDKLCYIGKKADCDAMIKSGASKVYGWVNWSDLGLAYFISGLVFLLITPKVQDLEILALFSYAALGFVFYSIYYQSMVLKIWCPLCILVQIVFVAEAANSFLLAWPYQLNIPGTLTFGSILLAVTFLTLLIKDLHQERRALFVEKINHLKIKKNERVFKSLLLSGDRLTDFDEQSVLTFGNPNANTVLTAFISLHCSPCRIRFNELLNLFKDKSIKLNLVFSFEDFEKDFVNGISSLKDEKSILSSLYIMYNGTSKQIEAMLKALSENKVKDVYESVSITHKSFFKANRIVATPTIFLNGYKFPPQYKISDIKFFTDALQPEMNLST